MLATLVLDDGAMDIIKQRHEGHLMFEATLRLLSHVMNALKFALAIGGDQILSEGMTEADVKAAMQQRHADYHGDPSGQGDHADPVALAGAPALARRLSTDAQQVAALLTAASTASKLGSCEIAGSQVSRQQSSTVKEEEVPEPLDVKTAVSLAEACAQAMWGSAHYSLEEPLHITQVNCSCLQYTCNPQACTQEKPTPYGTKNSTGSRQMCWSPVCWYLPNSCTG